MSSQNWEQFGEEIRRTVQDAIDNQDFGRLNQTITNTVNQAVESAAKGVKSFGDSIDRNKSGGYRGTAADDRNRRAVQLYQSGAGAKAGGIVLTALGGGFGAVVLLTMAGLAAAGAATGWKMTGFITALSVLVFALIGCGAMTGIGIRILGRIRRYRTYIRELNGREYCSLTELAESVKKSRKYIAKDLGKMIEKGWFRQGHMDRQKSCLMVTNQAYEQYLQLEKQMEQKRRDEAALEENKRNSGEAKITPEVQKVIERGDEFVRKIHACNEAIPGAEISAKISGIEMLVDRIFDRVEQNPESINDIRRLMDYYLPTTVKLLEAYEELDSQPAGGENIQTAKREIEATLDTLNLAFEKLLDDLFQDTAWDVSSDISVLNTMLAQEGLTADGLRNGK